MQRQSRRRSTQHIQGSVLRHNVSIGHRYARGLENTVDRMHRDITAGVKKILRGEFDEKKFLQDASIIDQILQYLRSIRKKYDTVFPRVGRDLAAEMARQTDQESQKMMNSVIKRIGQGFSISTQPLQTESGETAAFVEDIIERNANLIVSIPKKYIQAVRQDMETTLVRGEFSLQQLTDRLHGRLTARYKQHRNKAKNLALDQTRKAYNHLNAARMRTAGMDEFEWVHSGGGQRPRQYHKYVLNGKKFSLSDPPVIEPETGERGLPGDAINCGCTMAPTLTF